MRSASGGVRGAAWIPVTGTLDGSHAIGAVKGGGRPVFPTVQVSSGQTTILFATLNDDDEESG